jgi:large subunit ribosomal protein L18
MKTKSKQQARKIRHFRVRRKIKGTAERPRMCVFRSNKHLYIQFIDDEAARTLACASTITGPLASAKVTRETAGELGKLAAEKAKDSGITRVVFDRGGFAYGTRLRAMADAAREAGLQF